MSYIFNPISGSGSIGIGTTPITGGTPTDVLYVGAGPTLAQAANFNIQAGQPNVTTGSAYLYNNVKALFEVPNATADNWFIGDSGNSAVTGYGNMAMGHNALHNVSSGLNNIGIGAGALFTETSGQNNTCIGTQAGLVLNGSVLNTLIGTNAGVAATGTTNTFIGSSAGINVTSGSDNTFVGGMFGFATPCGGTVTTGGHNIAIGSGCDVPSASANGQLSIGNFIYGQNLTGTGSSVSTSGEITLGWPTNTSVAVGSAFQTVTASGTWGANFVGISHNSGSLAFACTGNASPNIQTIVSSTDYLMYMGYYGSDGAAYRLGAEYYVVMDGTPAAGSMPASQRWSTTPVGSVTPQERLRIDSNGRIIAGGSGGINIVTSTPKYQFLDTDLAAAQGHMITVATFNTANDQPSIDFAYSRNAVLGQQTIVQNGDWLGSFSMLGSDGVAFRYAATFATFVDGAPGLNSMPGRFVIMTNPPSNVNPIERLRIDSNGFSTFSAASGWTGGNTVVDGGNGYVQVVATDTINWCFSFINCNNGPGSNGFSLAKTRGSAPNVQTIVQSGDALADIFALGSDGVAYREAASLRMMVDNTPGAGSMPGRFSFFTSASDGQSIERMRIDALGQILGMQRPLAPMAAQSIDGTNSVFQSATAGGSYWNLSWIGYGNNAISQPYGAFARSRSSGPGSFTAILSGDPITQFWFYGDNGSAFKQAAVFSIEADAAPSGSFAPARFVFITGVTSRTESMRIDSKQNIVCNNAAIATNATDGFFYIETCAGTPTGVPTAYTGRVPMVFDTTNNQFWIYTGGAWKQPKTPAGAAIVNWQ
jgi:hypothetical protein